MVTLITEKLQNQSLDDLTHKACEAGPVSWLQRQGQSAAHVWCPRVAALGRGGLPGRELRGLVGWAAEAPCASRPRPVGVVGACARLCPGGQHMWPGQVL